MCRFSPDNRTLSASIYDNSGGEDIWLFDLTRGVKTRFTFGPNLNDDPVWSPDGRNIAFDTNRGGTYAIYEKPSNGAQKEELLFTDPAVKFTRTGLRTASMCSLTGKTRRRRRKPTFGFFPCRATTRLFP